MAAVSSCLPSSTNFTSSHPAANPLINKAAKNILAHPCNHGSVTVTRLISRRICRDFRLPAISHPQIDVDCPESELRARGISLTGIGDSCVVSMTLENGTAAKLLLPIGMITSFKPRMWHGGTVEVLHTLVSTADQGVAGDGAGALIQGGLSLTFRCENDAGVAWSPDAWTLHQVSGNPKESVQVELISRNEQAAGNADYQVKHIISLGRDLLSSEVVVHNFSSTSPLTIMGSALCHLAVSTPDATYAVGLEGSDFCIRPPLVSDFSIIPPDNPGKRIFDVDSQKLVWPFNKLFSEGNARNSSVENRAEILEGEEKDNYKHLTGKLSRIYTSAPRTLTILDRGRRNSVTVRRNGYNEVYIFSPGSEHEWYDKYSFVCIGHATLLEPVVLNAQSEWRGVLQVFNPNS